MSLPKDAGWGDIPKPTYEEVVEAANVALVQAAEAKALRGMEIDDPERYREALVEKFLSRHNWWKVHRLLGNLPEPLPELARAQSAPAFNSASGMRVSAPNGTVWVTKESFRRTLTDYEGDHDAGDVRVREPVDWLQKAHPGLYDILKEMVRCGFASTPGLLNDAWCDAERRWKRMLGDRDADTGRLADPKGFTERPVFLLDLHQSFELAVARKASSFQRQDVT